VIRSGLTRTRGGTIFWQAFLSDVLNPKVAMFFLAFVPQFVSADAAHPLIQVLLLGITVNMICLPINLLIAGFSARLTETLRQSSVLSTWLHRGMGALFIALGVRLAVEKP
jgi:threonine/homoserine/homoserine lactone efflux protein